MKYVVWFFASLALMFGGLGWFFEGRLEEADSLYRVRREKIENLNREVLFTEEVFWSALVPSSPKQKKIRSLVEMELAYKGLEKRLKNVEIDGWRRYNGLGHVNFRKFLIRFSGDQVLKKEDKALLAKSLALFKEARRRCDGVRFAEEARLCRRITSNNIDFLTRSNSSENDEVGSRTGFGDQVADIGDISLKGEERLVQPMTFRGASRGKDRKGSK